MTTTKRVEEQHQWSRVAEELAGESIKLASYDKTIFSIAGSVAGKRVLDYGCGPGVLASAFARFEANIHAFDISPEMRRLCTARIGAEHVYRSVSNVPEGQYDLVTCNLVLCIVEEDEVKNIVKNIRRVLSNKGRAYIGFCNPKIFNVPESQLDFRMPSGHRYDENHQYRKIKKEGRYEIVELHRPIEWYEQVYRQAELDLVCVHFTPEYELGGKRIEDFVIFELAKKEE